MTHQNILHGDEVEMMIPINLGEFMKLMLEMHEDKVLQVDADTGEEYTADFILKQGIRLARWLQAKGFCPGDTISIISENRLEFCIIPVAAYLAGITIAPLNPEYTPDELQHTINLSKPKVVFSSPTSLNRIVSASETCLFIRHIIVFGKNSHFQHKLVDSFDSILTEPFLDAMESEEFVVPQVDIDETVATIMCSSGTTGMPKGVMTSQKNMLTFLSILKQIANADMIESMDNISMGIVPFFHSMGYMIMNLSMIGGAKLVVIKKFKIKQFLESIEKHKVTILAVPPPIIVMLCQSPLVDKYDLSSIKEVRSGAAPLPKEFEKRVSKKLKLRGVTQAYGMTETTLGVLFIPPDSFKPGSVGKIVPSMSGKVIDEQGRALGPNCEGELCFKGPLIMKGYVNDPVSTANTIDADGWLHTGDIGYYDNDQYFFIVDRIKELIKYKAYQVPPAELEAILVSHPEILDAAVIGVPDDQAGELPLAFIVKKYNSKVTSQQLQNFVKGKVSPQKQLRGGVRFIEAIPRNPSGKILRRVLKQMVIENKSKL